LLPLESALDDIPGLILSEDEAERLQRGQQIEVISAPDDQTRLGTYQGVPVALIRCEQGKGQPIRVFNLMNEAMIQTKEMDDVDYKEPKG
jgi:tRNA U55 pseudouridine synthase TruB